MTLRLTYDQVLDGLIQAVGDRGANFVYADEWRDEAAGGCRNFDPHTGEPMCIAGYVYSVNGQGFAVGWEGTSVTGLMEVGLLEMDTRGAVLRAKAQESQDDGHTWGEAVSRGLAAVADYERKMAAGG